MSLPVNRRRFLSRSTVALLGCTGAAAGLAGTAIGLEADVADVPDTTTTRNLINDAAQRAIDDGLNYLMRSQHDNGSFGDRQYAGNVAVTSLAALAVMAAGHQPGRGALGKVVLDALTFVLSQEEARRRPGFLHNPNASPHGPMYGHGFGTLFLAEVHGMVHSKRLRDDLSDKLKRAVDLIIDTQNGEGGWRYQPERKDADLSVTVCQIMALRAARNAGLNVPKSTVDKCIEYVKACQSRDGSGGFCYLKQGGPPGFARTAAGVAALNSAGVYLTDKDPTNRDAITRGLRYLKNFKPNAAFGRHGLRDMHYFYGHYYAAQAMWTAGGTHWLEWFPSIRDELVSQSRARGDGSWSDQICTDYATAMALLVLQVSNNYLSIFQK
jgi:hypothetical protein